MALEGMDVDQVAGAARRVGAHTRLLEAIAAQLGGLAAELSQHWHGPAAATFQHDCETRHRPAIAAAALATSDMHQHLTANLAEQRRASAADGAAGGSIGSGSGGGIAGGVAVPLAIATWKAVDTVDKYAKVVEWPLDKVKEIAGVRDKPGHSHGVWSWLKKEGSKDLYPYYKDSKAVRFLKETPEIGRAAKFLEEVHVYRLLEQAPAIGVVIAGVSVGTDLGEAAYDHAHHNDYAAAADLMNAEADGVGAIPVVGVLGSFDIEMAKLDVQEIVNGGPIPSPFSWQNLKEDYAPLPSQMWQQLGADKWQLLDVAMGGHG